MKNLILIAALAAASFCSQAQTFSYEAKQIIETGTPSWSLDSLSITYHYEVTVGIVGEPYGFIAPNANKNRYDFTISAKEAKWNPDAIIKYAWGKAQEWVIQNYPDTK